MNKLLQLQNELKNLQKEAGQLLDANKIDEAKAKMEEIKNKKAAIEIQEELDRIEEEELKNRVNNIEENYGGEGTGLSKNKTKENANAVRAMIKKTLGQPLTEAENSLLIPTTGKGATGEGYILPEDISTLIHKKIRQYKSLRDVCGYIPATALSGSFPIENFETVTGLVDFADGTDGADSNDIKFTNVTYALKEKAAFIKLSNTLLALTDNALIAYVAEIFAKKAVVTENEMGIAALKKSKTAKAIADWKALKKLMNIDLDPAVMFGCAIVTNQDGFNALDEALDTTGRPMLQPNPANPTQKLFNGYPVHVYSNSMLPTTGTSTKKAPIIYGNIAEAVKYVDLNGQIAFATSSEAGFMSNTTIARLIEFIDVVQVDSSDKCYIYGEITVVAGA